VRFPAPPGAWWVLAAVGVGTFMSALDGSVVSVAIPVMSKVLHSSVASIEWVVVIYLLVVSGTLLMFGRLGDLRGYKKTYLLGFAVFVTGSALCGFAPDERVLIAMRGFQALGAAMVFACSPAILIGAFPPQRRGQVLGLQGTFTYLGLTAGPVLGGLLTKHFGWPAIFFINVPIGLLAIVLSWRFIQQDSGIGNSETFDVPGAATFLVGLVALTLALDQGSAWGWLSIPTLGLLAVAAALLGAFLVLETRMKNPMLDLSLFRNRTFASSTTTALLNYVAIYTVVFLMPFYLENGRGMSADQAGLLLAVLSLVMAVTAPLSGSLSDRIGTRTLVVLGMLLLAAGAAWLGLIGQTASPRVVALALALTGLGTGVFVSPNTSALLGSAPLHRRGIASGILAEARNVGMVLGVGLAGAVFTTQLRGAQPGPHPVFFHAISTSFLVAASVAVAGAVVAVISERDSTQKAPPHKTRQGLELLHRGDWI
jgi:EmrB/QacA subfamily drug resistance transporter